MGDRGRDLTAIRAGRGGRKALPFADGRSGRPLARRTMTEPPRGSGSDGSGWGYDPMAHQSFFLGTFAPSLRALDRPMAMACLGLVTFFFDLPPLLSSPRFISCIASLTSSWALGPYFFAMAHP